MLYCFYDIDTGEEFEIEMSLELLYEYPGEKGTYQLLDGRKVRINHSAQHGSFRRIPKEFYHESDAAGIHPMDIAEERALCKKHGFSNIDFLPDGRLAAKSKKEFVEYLALKGMNYRQGGYSETVPDSKVMREEFK